MADWYYNSNTGIVTESGAAQLLLHAGVGWHGPFPSHDAAVQFYNDGKKQNPGWEPPVSDTNITGIIGNSVNQVGSRASEVTSAISDKASDPFGLKAKIGDLQNWFLRGGEILIGLVLIGVGLNALTGNPNVVTNALKSAGNVKGLLKFLK